MKYLKFVFAFMLVSVSHSTFSQKIKIKGDAVLIDDVVTYKVDEEGKSSTLSTMAGNEFITLLKDGFEYYEGGNRFYTKVYTIKFLVEGTEVITDMSEKDIIKAIFKSGMVGADGKIDEQKMNIFVNKYNNENLKYKLAK